MRLSHNRNAIIFLGLFLILISASTIYKYSNQPPKLHIAVSEWAGSAPLVYAQVLGLYEKYGLPVELVYSTGPTQSYEFLKSERVEGVFAVLTDLILLRSIGFGVSAVFFTDYSKEGDAILSVPEIKNVKDLKGKTIGIDGYNTFSHVFVLKILEKHGLSERDVFFKVVTFDKALEALSHNEVQASHTWDPVLREGLMQGYRRLASAAELPGLILDCIAFREDIIKKYPDAIKKLTKIFFEAQTKMIENPFHAAESMKYFFKNDPDQFARSFKDIHFLNMEDNNRRMRDDSLDSFSKSALEINQIFLKRGQTNENDLHHRVIMENYKL